MPGSEFFFRADDGVRLLGAGGPGRASQGDCPDRYGLAEHSARYARLAGRSLRRTTGFTPTTIAATGLHAIPPLSAISPMRTAGRNAWATYGPSTARSRRSKRERRSSSSGTRWGRSSANTSFPNTARRSPASPIGQRQAAADGRRAAPDRRAERLRQGGRGKSRLVNSLMFDSLNKPFAPARTKSDWLSRDTGGSRRLCRRPALRLRRQQPAGDRLPRRLARGCLRGSAWRASGRTCRSTSSPANAIRSARISRARRRPEGGRLYEARDPHLPGRAP